MLTVVTACDDKYIPGAKALYHSIKKNVPEGEIDFYCLYFGEDSSLLRQTGMKVIDNPSYPEGLVFPIGGRWAPNIVPGYPGGLNPSPYAMPAMYARILLGQLFPDLDRVFWVDADCLVMQSIKELETVDLGEHVVAGVDITDLANGNFKSKYIDKRNGNDLGHKAFGCGTMLVNIPQWNRKRIMEQCFQVMNSCESKGEMLAVVQSVLILVVKDDFVPIPERVYLYNIKQGNLSIEAKIIHFPIMIPWCEIDLKRKPAQFVKVAKDYWEPYR